MYIERVMIPNIWEIFIEKSDEVCGNPYGVRLKISDRVTNSAF